MRRYTIVRTEEGVKAVVNGRALPLCLGIRNHSPTGFEYGFGGSGPAQLSLALLVDHFKNNERDVAEARERLRAPGETPNELALRCYQTFKAAVIAAVPQATERWTLNSTEITASLRSIYSVRAA